MYGKGISKEGSLIDVGVDLEIVKKSGAWFTYEGDQLGQGRENARQFLAEHVDVRDEIDRKVREAVGLTGFTESDDEPITIGEAEPPPLDEPPPSEEPVAAGKRGKGSG
jgi:recombination protein RecA